MTGAGASTVAFGKEQTFKGDLVESDGTPDYWKFGRNPSVNDLSLDRALTEMSEGDQAEYVESVAGNIEGAVEIEAVISSDVHSDVEDLVFNDNGSFKPGLAASGRVFVGIDYLSGTAERELIGCIPLEYTVNYEQGEPVSYTLSMGYATEQINTSITPANITSVNDGTSAMFHGVTIDIDGTSVTKLQSASLSISGISRFQRGADEEAVDAVLARPETRFTVNSILTGPSRTELAYGGSSLTQPATRMDSVSGSFDIAIDGTSVSTYNLPKIKPSSNSWENAISDGETDTADATTFNVNGGVSV